MTTYHRYLVGNEKRSTLEQIRSVVHTLNPRVDFDSEVVLYDGEECGVFIDVIERENPSFNDDLQVVADRLRSRNHPDPRLFEWLEGCSCMVTTQVISSSNDLVLDTIWEALGSYLPGILVLEDYASTVRLYVG